MDNFQTLMFQLNALIDEKKDPDGSGEEPEYLDEYDQAYIDGVNAAKDVCEELHRVGVIG